MPLWEINSISKMFGITLKIENWSAPPTVETLMTHAQNAWELSPMGMNRKGEGIQFLDELSSNKTVSSADKMEESATSTTSC